MVRVISVLLILIVLCLPVGLWGSSWYQGGELKGMHLNAPKPQFSWQSFWLGEYQSQFTEYFNQRFALRSEYVKLNNELYYDLFRKSYMYKGDLIIGDYDYIYERYYLDDYTTCRATDQELKTLIADIEIVQKKLMEYDKKFCFIITPSKVRTIPEFVPDGYKEIVLKNDLPYDKLIAALKSTGIYYIDGQEIIRSEKQKTGKMLFAKGGTHWNEMGTAIMMTEITRFLNQRYDLELSMPELAKVTTDLSPKGYDRDLYDLLNLIRPASYEVEHLSWNMVYAGEKQYHIGFIGGSFCWNLVDFMQETKQYNPIDVYFYYRLGNSHFNDGKREELDTLDKLTASKWREEILKHDIIILELNSSMPIEPLEEFLKAAKLWL